MLKAEKTSVTWDATKKSWHVRLQIGEEVIKRPLAKTPQDATEEILRSMAVAAAGDEGYHVEPAQVDIQR